MELMFVSLGANVEKNKPPLKGTCSGIWTKWRLLLFFLGWFACFAFAFVVFDFFLVGQRLEVGDGGLPDLVRVVVGVRPVPDGSDGRDGAQQRLAYEGGRNLDANLFHERLEGRCRKLLDNDAASGADGDVAQERRRAVPEQSIGT